MNYWYSFFIILGIVAGTSFFFWQLKRKNMPNLIWLFILFTGTIIFGLLGARLWTYLFSDVLWNQINQKKAFVEQLKSFFGLNSEGLGGLSVHGALIFGLIYCLIIFNWYSKKYQISIWICLDAMAKAVLICQIIGRWGNFFNQELLGAIITKNYPTEFDWIPRWFGEKLKFKQNDAIGTLRQPLFLYESFANFVVLIFMVFILPYLGIFFSEELKKHPTLKKIKKEKNNLWGWIKWKIKKWKTLKKLWKNNINYPIKTNQKMPQIRIHQWKIGKKNILPIFSIKLYNRQKIEIKKEKNKLKKIWLKICLFLQRDCQEITQTYNPLKLKITMLGVTFFSFFLSYGIIRLILQPMRSMSEAALSNHPMSITSIISIIFVIIGFLGMIIWQFVVPYKWRSQAWFYECWYYI